MQVTDKRHTSITVSTEKDGSVYKMYMRLLCYVPPLLCLFMCKDAECPCLEGGRPQMHTIAKHLNIRACHFHGNIYIKISGISYLVPANDAVGARVCIRESISYSHSPQRSILSC